MKYDGSNLNPPPFSTIPCEGLPVVGHTPCCVKSWTNSLNICQKSAKNRQTSKKHPKIIQKSSKNHQKHEKHPKIIQKMTSKNHPKITKKSSKKRKTSKNHPRIIQKMTNIQKSSENHQKRKDIHNFRPQWVDPSDCPHLGLWEDGGPEGLLLF